MCFSAEKSIHTINKFTQLIKDDEEKVINLVKSTKHVTGVYEYYKRHLISEIKPISESMGVSFNTVSKAVNALSDAGVLQIENEQSRHRVFVYNRLVEILI